MCNFLYSAAELPPHDVSVTPLWSGYQSFVSEMWLIMWKWNQQLYIILRCMLNLPILAYSAVTVPGIVLYQSITLEIGLQRYFWLTSVYYVGFEVFTAVVLKSIFFWDMTPCSALKGTTQRITRRHIPEEDTLHLCTTSSFHDFLCHVENYNGKINSSSSGPFWV
jgi:hypothetical protein